MDTQNPAPNVPAKEPSPPGPSVPGARNRGGAPKGNRNAYRHGLYAKSSPDSLDEPQFNPRQFRDTGAEARLLYNLLPLVAKSNMRDFVQVLRMFMDVVKTQRRMDAARLAASLERSKVREGRVLHHVLETTTRPAALHQANRPENNREQPPAKPRNKPGRLGEQPASTPDLTSLARNVLPGAKPSDAPLRDSVDTPPSCGTMSAVPSQDKTANAREER